MLTNVPVCVTQTPMKIQNEDFLAIQRLTLPLNVRGAGSILGGELRSHPPLTKNPK